MSHAWQRELQRHPLLVELQRRKAVRRKELEADKEYLYEWERLRQDVKRAIKRSPKTVRLFFDRFSESRSDLAQVHEFLETVGDETLNQFFCRYIRFVSRFRVEIGLERGKTKIHREIIPPLGSKFHLVLGREGFEPFVSNSDEDVPNEYLFERSDLVVPERLEHEIKSGTAKMVQIEDHKWVSTLGQLERFAYHPEGITLILHQAELPYLYCMIGENVSVRVWRDMYPVIKALRKKHYGREKAGRPPDLKRQKEVIKTFALPGPDKVKAIEKARTDNPNSSIVYHSKLKRKLAHK